MPTEKVEKVTEEQAGAALQQLMGEDESEPTSTVQMELPVKETTATGTEETEGAATTSEQGQEQVQETDDVVSLKKRLEESEAKGKVAEERFEARSRAVQQRAAENERILRNRFLQKATVTDRALKTLRATRTKEGVPEADVDRAIQEIESSMNPSSPSYVSPTEATGVTEDQAIVLNGFLNEKGMTGREAEDFGKWIRSDGSTALSQAEQAVAAQSLDGFLRIAHDRWQSATREQTTKRSDAVEAVRTVQRTQKEAARAAGTTPAAPRRNPVGASDQIDYRKIKKEDVAALLRASVEQYR